MCQLHIIRYVCDCQSIVSITPCQYFMHEGFEICGANRLTPVFTDHISSCDTCTASRRNPTAGSLINPVLGLHGSFWKLERRQFKLAKAYEEIGKLYHRVPLGIRSDPRLPESQRQVYASIFHGSVSREANPWFSAWRSAERSLALAVVGIRRSLEAGQTSFAQARLHTEVAEARLVAARQYVNHMYEVWRLRPHHLNTNADILQADIYIRQWLPSLSVSWMKPKWVSGNCT